MGGYRGVMPLSARSAYLVANVTRINPRCPFNVAVLTFVERCMYFGYPTKQIKLSTKRKMIISMIVNPFFCVDWFMMSSIADGVILA